MFHTASDGVHQIKAQEGAKTAATPVVSSTVENRFVQIVALAGKIANDSTCSLARAVPKVQAAAATAKQHQQQRRLGLCKRCVERQRSKKGSQGQLDQKASFRAVDNEHDESHQD